MSERCTIGVQLSTVRDLKQELETAKGKSIDFLIVPLVHPRFSRKHQGGAGRQDPLTRSDLILNASEWNNFIVGSLSPWIQLDATNEQLRVDSLRAFKEELAWASHISVGAVLMPMPVADSVHYARACMGTLQQATYIQLLVKVPLISYQVQNGATDDEGTVTTAGRPEASSWESWSSLREQCNHHNNLCVALELSEDLPARSDWQRWIGEPVKLVLIPTKVFSTNKKGFPVLSKGHQELLMAFFRHKEFQYVITGASAGYEDGIASYVHYVNWLWEKKPEMTPQEVYESPYYDYLQTPLQPLMDNLESQTYEVFEQDPVKYREYEQAVYEALLARNAEHTVVYVVGAGRGPLVRASLRASDRAQKKIQVYAVEKNVNAVVTLRNAKITEKWDNVEIISGDMRVQTPKYKADIMVSELLGSFGDNELSPECLDGAQAYLAPNGISIPANYTSFLQPITSHKLWNEVRNHSAGSSEYAAFTSHSVGFETGYVVKIHDHIPIGDSKKCFYFEHPNYDSPIDNTRFVSLSWTAEESSMLHGFAGYFETVLFKDVMLSINPETASEGMFSWFPLFFPLKKPTRVAKGETIQLNMWRMVSDKKVWYEWTMTSPQMSTVHNLNGKSYWIGL